MNSNCIEQLYLYCLGKYDSRDCKKIVVEFSLKEGDNFEYMLDVIGIKKVFDFEKYYKVSEKYEKKKMILDFLQAGILAIAKHEGWEREPLENAYNCCIAKGVEYKWLRKDKYFLSPDRKYYAGVFCDWDIDKFEAFAVFLNKQKEEIKRVRLYEREPWNVDPLGKMGWDKETGEFYLYSKDERNKWTASPS